MEKPDPIKQRAFCQGCQKISLQTKPDSGASVWTCDECKKDANQTRDTKASK